ncbi:hypothetical protein P0082_03360 [Candidatus Haliotispira prima]|uniref:Uncharacterized protein n=1 Tax=Candidatus Haliotispira prima TaxID=3034016 RepID=A0ABY8MMA0_9SPIO|nr:hypothetical protein P0082_03360 [Candidatus Haliotispira prima]
MASSLQLEMSSNVALANIGAVVRLATETAPTETEAMAGKGHVSISIPAGITRKISISQHYGSIFSDGLALSDVLTPNTAYKLYLYFPAGRITATAEIAGLSITNDKAIVPFTTAMLPAEGDAKWLNNNSKCVVSIDTYYFMQEQTGVAICYFYRTSDPLLYELLTGSSPFNNVGNYDRTSGGIPSAAFNFAYGSISGYTSNSTNHYTYWIGGDGSGTLQNTIRSTIIDFSGTQTVSDIPVTRH